MNSNLLCPYCKSALIMKWSDESFFRCKVCQLLVRNESYTQQSLDNLYFFSWTNPHRNTDETGGTTDELSRQFCAYLLHSLGIESFSGLKLMDFGAGRGSMTFSLKEAGADVSAVEPFGTNYLLEKGISAYQDLETIPKETQFNGIVSLDVVEHLSRPWEVLKALNKFLVPGGWIFISTPNSDSLNARITGSRWREAQRKGHLYLFNSHSLINQLMHAGYKNIRKLHWNVTYNNSSFSKIKNQLLLTLRLDGELRFLSYKD